MPYTVVNKLTGESRDVSASEIRSIKYPPSIWQVVSVKDIVKVYKPKGIHRIDIGTYERVEAIELLANNADYFFEAVPDFESTAPASIQTHPHKTKDQAGIVSLKKSLNIFIKIINSDWVKFLLIGAASGMITWYLTTKVF